MQCENILNCVAWTKSSILLRWTI